MIYNLILASGSGSRLYPLSTEDKPKQFLKLISDKMMIFETVDRFKDITDTTVAVTLDKYIKHIDTKDSSIDVVITEEDRKGTAHSVNAFLKLFNNQDSIYSDDDIIIQTPSDHFIKNDKAFNEAIREAIEIAKNDEVVCVGVKPRGVECEYGYVKDGESFIEKPNSVKAEELISNDYLWNTGIYVYKINRMVEYYNLYFDNQKESIEDLILSKVKIRVVNGEFEWQDLGTSKRLEEYERFWGWSEWQRKGKEEREVRKEGQN